MLRSIIIIGFTLALMLSAVSWAHAQAGGVVLDTDDAFPGYTLFAPLGSTTTYLIDNNGQVINSWASEFTPGNAVYLLENGHLLRTGATQSQTFTAGGIGGIVQEFTWDGDLVWEFSYASPLVHLHHDIEVMPNGHILMIAWEYKSADEALAAGRDPALLPTGEQHGPGQPAPTNGDQGLWVDHIIEVDPATDAIVWEWHVWDHLVQDVDPAAPNYGTVADNPARIDLNYSGRRVNNDWNHVNSIDYHPDLDQIVLSVHTFNEIWIIDHSLTTEAAAGPAGDLLYRWGNPAAYGGTGAQQLFAQHDARWIELGLPGEGNILIFNNGDRQTRPYSSVEEIATPVDDAGQYAAETGTDAPVWQYVGDFFAQNISGAQRLPNGHTLICDGPNGTFIEVTPDGETVWEYVNPVAVQRGDRTANEVFRAERYALDYSAFAGRDVSPGAVLVSTTASVNPPGGASGPTGNQPNNQSGSPPQAALTACAGLAAGDVCQFTGPRGHEVTGTCRAVQGQVICAPQRPGR